MKLGELGLNRPGSLFSFPQRPGVRSLASGARSLTRFSPLHPPTSLRFPPMPFQHPTTLSSLRSHCNGLFLPTLPFHPSTPHAVTQKRRIPSCLVRRLPPSTVTGSIEGYRRFLHSSPPISTNQLIPPPPYLKRLGHFDLILAQSLS